MKLFQQMMNEKRKFWFDWHNLKTNSLVMKEIEMNIEDAKIPENVNKLFLEFKQNSEYVLKFVEEMFPMTLFGAKCFYRMKNSLITIIFLQVLQFIFLLTQKPEIKMAN